MFHSIGFFLPFFTIQATPGFGSGILKAYLNNRINVSSVFRFMENKYFFRSIQLRLCLSILAMVLWHSPATAISSEPETISLKTYPQRAFPFPNPIDLTKMATGKSYQVTHSKFILQFFSDGKNIYGIILKRNKDVSIYIHWCFFRSCEESSYDYKLKIADAFRPPYDQTFFTAKLPPQMKYKFQGLEFYTRK